MKKISKKNLPLLRLPVPEDVSKGGLTLRGLLDRRLSRRTFGSRARNSTIDKLFRSWGDTSGFLSKLSALLEEEGALMIPTETRSVKMGTKLRRVTIARAAKTDMWPMGTHLWIRDNAIIGARLLTSEIPHKALRRKHRSTGRRLLLSAMTVMSSPAQLGRFRAVIATRDSSYKNNPCNWPHIFLDIKTNLSGVEQESWGHQQDAWQILAYYVLDALERQIMDYRDLTAEHVTFLGMVAPFLARIDFVNQENSGSWEELVAVRTSVIGWEFALLRKLLGTTGALRKRLEQCFKIFAGKLPREFSAAGFEGSCRKLVQKGAVALSDAMPHECPTYPVADPRYREADAALIYLLQLDIPGQVAEELNLSARWVRGCEARILSNVEVLYDKATGCYRRYLKDSYQRHGFFRPETIYGLNELYGATSGDASGHFVARDRIVPAGREAAWTHFSWQLCAWASRKYLATGNRSYETLARTAFSRALRTITGAGEWTVEQIGGLKLRLKSIPAFRIPECYITDSGVHGKQLVFPSPHTPLNWAVAETIDALGAMYRMGNTKAFSANRSDPPVSSGGGLLRRRQH